MKTVDVIIPVHRPDGRLQKILNRLDRQTVKVSRVILINTDKASYPEDKIRLTDCAELYHIDAADFDHGGTRDMAARKSDADYLLFMTQDAVPEDPYLVEKLLGAFDEPGTAVAYARQMPLKTDSLTEQYTRTFNYPAKSRRKTAADIPKIGIKTYFCSNACAMYDRSIYFSLGGFMPQSIFNEDMVFAAKAIHAGFAVSYVAEARVIHSHNYTPLEQLHRNFDNGVSQVISERYLYGVKAAGEGIRLVLATSRYLLRTGGFRELPGFFAATFCKGLGFYLGKNYEKLPEKMVRSLSMNKAYWD